MVSPTDRAIPVIIKENPIRQALVTDPPITPLGLPRTENEDDMAHTKGAMEA